MQGLVGVVPEGVIAQETRVLLDRLVGVGGASSHIEVAQNLGSIPAVATELVRRIELLRDAVGLRRELAPLELHAVEVSEAVEQADPQLVKPVSYTHLRAHETPEHLVCR